jgi:hypothetical protein
MSGDLGFFTTGALVRLRINHFLVIGDAMGGELKATKQHIIVGICSGPEPPNHPILVNASVNHSMDLQYVLGYKPRQ